MTTWSSCTQKCDPKRRAHDKLLHGRGSEKGEEKHLVLDLCLLIYFISFSVTFFSIFFSWESVALKCGRRMKILIRIKMKQRKRVLQTISMFFLNLSPVFVSHGSRENLFLSVASSFLSNLFVWLNVTWKGNNFSIPLFRTALFCLCVRISLIVVLLFEFSVLNQLWAKQLMQGRGVVRPRLVS